MLKLLTFPSSTLPFAYLVVIKSGILMPFDPVISLLSRFDPLVLPFELSNILEMGDNEFLSLLVNIGEGGSGLCVYYGLPSPSRKN